MSTITVSIATECFCLLPADFLHPTAFCSSPFLGFRIGVSPSHIPFRVFWRNFPGRSARSLISASPPNYLLLYSVTRGSFQKLQFNLFTILLFTGPSLLSVFCPSVAREVQTTSPPKMPTKTHPYKKAGLPTPQNITTTVHWLVSRPSSPMLDLVKVTETKVYQHGPSCKRTPGHLRPGVTWHPLTPQSILPWTLATGDYRLSRVTTIRKSPTEFMIAETKRGQRPSLNPQIFWEFYQITLRRNHCWTPRFTFWLLQVVTNLESYLPSQRLKSTLFHGDKTYLTIRCHISPS